MSAALRKPSWCASIGADHVIDYTKEDFGDGRNRYDVILDNGRQPPPFPNSVVR